MKSSISSMYRSEFSRFSFRTFLIFNQIFLRQENEEKKREKKKLNFNIFDYKMACRERKKKTTTQTSDLIHHFKLVLSNKTTVLLRFESNE